MINRRNCSLALCLSAMLLLATMSASASSVTYASASGWATATTGPTEITFAGIAPSGSFTNEGTSSGLVIDGVDFVGQLTATTNQLNVVDQLYASPYYNWGVPALLESPIYNLPANPTFLPYIRVNLPANTTAFAALLGTVSPNSLTYQVTLSDGEVFTVATGARPSLTFFGLTAANPITWADFTISNPGTYSGGYGVLTNFQFATANTGGGGGQVPEPGSMILIGSGLLAAYGWRKGWRVSLPHGANAPRTKPAGPGLARPM